VQSKGVAQDRIAQGISAVKRPPVRPKKGFGGFEAGTSRRRRDALCARRTMKLSRPVSHVIFDLDGVLLDTERLYTQATQAVLDAFGKRFTWAAKQHMMGRSEIVSAQILVDWFKIPISVDEYIERRNVVLYELIGSSEPLEGAPEFVALLAAQEVPMAIATSSRRPIFKRKTSHHEWLEPITEIVCGDDPEVGAFKPAPDIFLVTAQRLGVAPERCVVFEDSPAGVAAGVAAGMQVIAVADPSLDARVFDKAAFVIRGYDELRLEDLGF
jgi:beta-phosphoglucomutase-like phosphatase (HAD superfamily)